MSSMGDSPAGRGEVRYADRYRVIHRLGAGGMATVFLAEDERLGRQVAIKRLRAESSEDAAARFRREARVGASLNHPNLVTVYDILAEEEAVLIVMEYLPGGDLARNLKEGTRLGADRSLEILRGVAAGLDHAHARGVVHRDVKPSNILLGARGDPKLTDLGVAKVLEDTSSTRAGAMPGTPLYMAPEQLRGEPVGPTTDVYSLALTAFQILAGRPARRGGTIPELAHKAVNEPPPDIRQAWPEAPEEVSKVLCRGMDRDPDRRPQRASELVAELEKAVEGAPAPPPVTRTAPLPLPPTATETAPEPEPDPTIPAPEPTPPDSEPPAPPPAAGPPTPPPAIPAPASHRRRSRLGPIAALAGLAAVALVAVLLVSSGDEGGGGRQPAQAKAAGKQAGGSGEPRGGSEGASAPAAAAGSPAAAVRDFYESAADGDYATAWDKASPDFQALFGSEDGLAGEFSTLESIEFTSLDTTSESGDTAEVSFSTVATHTDHTDTCSGTATLVRGSSGWLLDNPGVDCTSSG
jgi:serine/threonine protein kinase